MAALQPLLDAAGVDVRLVAGAEVALDRAVDLSEDELLTLHLGDGPWLLLAHRGRSPLFLRDPDLLDALVAESASAGARRRGQPVAPLAAPPARRLLVS